MDRRQVAVWLLGGVALGLFLAMVLLLYLAVKPKTGFLPQSAWLPYDATTLAEFSNRVKRSGLATLYHATLTYLDTAFFVSFAIWCALAHLWRSTARLRWVGAGLGAVAAGLDAWEGAALRARLKLDDKALIMLEDVSSGTSDIYPITLVKLLAYTAALASAYALVWRKREARA